MLEFLYLGFLVITSFVVVLSFLVFFHELGHYSVARLFDVAIERFSIGFGKPIFQRRAPSGTLWTISRIPLGGYVKFVGDSGAASNPDQETLQKLRDNIEANNNIDINKIFHFKPLWQKALIVLAGPVANFILAIFLFALVALFFGSVQVRSVVTSVIPGGAADRAGVQVGDKFLTMDGHDVSQTEELISYVAVRSNTEIRAEVDRRGEIIEFMITPERQARKDAIGGVNDIGTIGIALGGADNYEVVRYNPISALGRGMDQFGNTISTTGTYIGRIFRGKEDGRAFGGPLRIATITGKATVDIAKEDIDGSRKLKAVLYTLLSLSAAISVGLGVANLMPIPALDGGHLLYYGYEAIAGHPLSERKQEMGFRIGFALLLALLFYLTINDFGYLRSLFS